MNCIQLSLLQAQQIEFHNQIHMKLMHKQLMMYDIKDGIERRDDADNQSPADKTALPATTAPSGVISVNTTDDGSPRAVAARISPAEIPSKEAPGELNSPCLTQHPLMPNVPQTALVIELVAIEAR